MDARLPPPGGPAPSQRPTTAEQQQQQQQQQQQRPLPPQSPRQNLPGLFTFLFMMWFINAGPASLSYGSMSDAPFSLVDQANATALPTPRESFEAYLAGNQSIWEPPDPSPGDLLQTLAPPLFARPHDPTARFAPNVTGFIRHETSVSFNLSDPLDSLPSVGLPFDLARLPSDAEGSLRAYLPSLNLTSPVLQPNDTSPAHNRTRALVQQGHFPWLAPGGKAQAHELAFNLREGWWGHALNHPVSGTALKTEEEDAMEWSNVKGSVEMSPIEGGNQGGGAQSFTLQGLHHRKNGTFYLAGSPSGDPDLRPLPYLFATGTRERNDVLRFVRREMAEDEERGAGRKTTDDLGVASPQTTCPILLVLQLALLDPSLSNADLRAAEAEARHPTGLPVPTVEIRVESGVWWSWDCEVAGVLSGKGEVLRAESFWAESLFYAFAALLSQATILALMVWQMEVSRTPAALAKIATSTIGLQCLLDGVNFLGHVMVGIVVGRSTLALMGTAFCALLTAVLFGPRWLVTIRNSQAGERPVTRAAPVAPAPPAVATPPAPVVVPVQPPPRRGEVVPPTPPPTRVVPSPAEPSSAPPAVPPPPQVMPGALPRFPITAPPPAEAPSPILVLLLFFLLIMQTDILPLVFPFILFLAYGFWIPQIWRNATRGTRRALKWRYVLGTSIARGYWVGYFGSGWRKDNVLFLEGSNWATAIFTLQVAQITILALQDLVGPTFFLPARYAPPPPYNYHPALPTLTPGDVEKSGGEVGWDEGDCAICMEPLRADGDDGAARSVAGGRRDWALAPCHHVFHTACLEPWMAIRAVCPQCRRPLPPLS